GADLIIAGIPPALAEPLLQLLREIPRGLLQLIERLGLRPDRLASFAALQRAGRVAHSALGAAERIGDVAHALAEPAHQFAERTAQAFLLAGFVAHLAGLPHLARIAVPRLALAALALPALLPLLSLLSLLPLLALLALRPEALVEELLLALHQLLQAAHHLLRFAGAGLHLPGPVGTQVFQHVLHLRQQFARLIARADARHLAGAVEHALEVAAGDDLGRTGRLPRRIRIALHLLGER